VLDQGVRLEQSGDYVEFWEAGSDAKGQFHCADCGYGVSIQTRLPSCPMCGGRSWEQSPTSPLARWTPPL
jgi:rubrerythrin